MAEPGPNTSQAPAGPGPGHPFPTTGLTLPSPAPPRPSSLLLCGVEEVEAVAIQLHYLLLLEREGGRGGARAR